MVHFEERYWRMLAKLEKMAGFWPYNTRTRKLAVKILFPILVLSCTCTVIIRIQKEWNVNFHIVLESTLLAILHIVLMVKFSVYIVDKPRREIFEQVLTHIGNIFEEDEVAILRHFYKKAWTLTIQYAAFFVIAFGFYDTLPIARMFFGYFFGNGTLEKELPFYVDYLVDEQDYFYYILAHLTMIVVACATVEFAFELNYFLTVRHVCALFEIVKLRLKTASEIFQQSDQNTKLPDSDERKAFKIISSAVELHNEALKLIESVDKVYRNCWFVVLVTNMAGLAPLPIFVVIYLHYPIELLRRFLILLTILAHFYVVFLQGQMTIDYSESIFDSCYDFCWYSTSRRCQVVISIMMSRSLRPSRLSGILFDLSMETYSKMLKTALSYISMFTALDITIPQ